MQVLLCGSNNTEQYWNSNWRCATVRVTISTGADKIGNYRNQEFEALVTLSKAGILELNTLELEDNVDVSAVSPDDLARLLASCKWCLQILVVQPTVNLTAQLVLSTSP